MILNSFFNVFEAASYLFLEPLVGGKVVLGVGADAAGAQRLRAAGAASVALTAPPSPKLTEADDTIDVLVCTSALDQELGDGGRNQWLAEFARVMRKTGFCVVGAGAGLGREALEGLLRRHFPMVALVEVRPFAGLSFSVPDREELAINEELAGAVIAPTHWLGFCSRGQAATWDLPESLLVATAGAVGQAPAGVPGAVIERDELRESIMTLRDQLDRRDESLAAVRRDAERYLNQISDGAAKIELLAIERERAERRLATGEQVLANTTTELRRREADVLALEAEIAQLRKIAERRRA